MSQIRLSPKHGLNPSMVMCFWCGEEKNELVLLGRMNREDSEAPRKILRDYEPCDKCKELFSHGVHIIGVSETPAIEGLPPITVQNHTEYYPTGVFTLVSDDYIVRVLDSEPAQQVLKARKMLMHSDELQKLLNEYNSQFEEESTNESCESGIPEDC